MKTFRFAYALNITKTFGPSFFLFLTAPVDTDTSLLPNWLILTVRVVQNRK